ncbi:peptidase M16C associated-domain-containing protein [Lipomyces arxii]|uniref:peptidase M16C associated-domain-containing protein n=1 Tax=Lipomyces arxii TaxID=56418 RepID=UPI0034CEBB8F
MLANMLRRASGRISVLTNSRIRALASVADAYPVGTRLHGYEVSKSKHVPELDLVALKLRHLPTGAEHLHVARDDDNNVFSIAFKTNPPDATGVPHILEHTTLCGSEKYNVRDPFFKMLNRSLANFMNAMTASDYTYYPFATTNEADFANLRDVYLDATLHPLLRKLDFLQEGWRLEHADPTNRESPLTFKGVVYNEMKGQMSDSSYLFYIRFQESIYPSLNNSGGDPAKITNLTYDGLKSFHAKNYHPSNAKVYTYGNFPLEHHLEHLDSMFSQFTPSPRDVEVKYPIKLTETKRVIEEGPIDPLSDPARQFKTSLTWFLGPSYDLYDGLCLSIVTSLLTDGHASPLYQALIESDLGTDFSPNTGLDTSSPVNIFSVGLQGVAEENLTVVEETIRNVMQKTYTEGLDLNRVEGILHQAELYRKHKVANFGMNLLNRIVSGWFNNVDPLEMLEWNSYVTRLREDLKKPRFLESYMEKYLLADSPVFAYTMVPKENYSVALSKEEEDRLQSRVVNLTDADKENVYELGVELLQKQNEKEDLSSLPTLHLADIPLEMKRTELEHVRVENVPLQLHAAPTNGLTYMHGLMSLQDIPEDLHQYLPLFAEALTNLGTISKTMAELEEEIKLKTGGISVAIHLCNEPADIDSWKLSLALSGYSLEKDLDEVFRLLTVLLTETNFDNYEKLRTLIRGMASGAADEIASNGHAYAIRAAASVLTPRATLAEKLSGMEQVKFVAKLDAYTDEQLPLISEKLKQIAAIAIANNQLKVALTCSQDAMESTTPAVAKFVTGLPPVKSSGGSVAKVVASGELASTFYKMPFQVNYVGIGIRGVPYDHPDGAPLQVLSNLLTRKYLHAEIREKGGAYGGGATYDAMSGVFGFYSYRDPNPENTLRTAATVGEFAVSYEWTDRDLEEAKLGIFQGIDAPISADKEGLVLFMNGITDDMRQQRRERLLRVSVEDIKDVAKRYLVDNTDRSTAVLGPLESWVDNSKWKIADAGFGM